MRINNGIILKKEKVRRMYEKGLCDRGMGGDIEQKEEYSSFYHETQIAAADCQVKRLFAKGGLAAKYFLIPSKIAFAN